MSKIRAIEINFPVAVELPEGFERALDALVETVCDKYKKEHPGRVMWPAGCGAKILWDEPNEPDFDASVYCIDVAEREDLHGETPTKIYCERPCR